MCVPPPILPRWLQLRGTTEMERVAAEMSEEERLDLEFQDPLKNKKKH
jgi:hypothetical protein